MTLFKQRLEQHNGFVARCISYAGERRHDGDSTNKTKPNSESEPQYLPFQWHESAHT